ncbi:MAG: adenylate/guanylate cyclase domain-containing protein [Deltaproteobacteria bacterium]|nr:adenylate/guanylate cyclase domain-containing protein [Deltaproteobacteria bacterium]
MGYTLRIGTNASMDRLESLISQRLEAGADKVAIDARIRDLFGERWAVMFTDLSGFSRGVAEFGIVHFLQVIFESLRVLSPVIESHDGVLLKMEGDSMLVIFRRPARALDCALAMQRALKDYNKDKGGEEQILLCLGLGYGDMLRIGDDDVFGAEVNAASKLGEDTADPWEILVTDDFKTALEKTDGLSFEELPEAPPGADKAYRVGYSF